MHRSILCLDIGSGTQDGLLFLPGRELENCPKFVLPSPARLVAARIESLTAAGRNVYLYGRNMGGGFFFALRRHLQAGLRAACHPVAALALADDPARIESLGVALAEECPRGYSPVHLADFEPSFWHGLLAQAGLDYPDLVLAAAQDHGFHPGESNRLGRFTLWRSFLEEGGGDLAALVHLRPPAILTRLRAIQESTGGGPVADTGAAAVLGALFEPDIEAMSRERGICLVNLGNSHALGFLLFRGRVHGIYEHHTGSLSSEGLWDDLEKFRKSELDPQKVLAEGGHGVYIGCLPSEAEGFGPTVVLGPRRRLLSGYDALFPAPGGDMMLSGAFGLLRGLALVDDDFAAVLERARPARKKVAES